MRNEALRLTVGTLATSRRRPQLIVGFDDFALSLSQDALACP